MSDPLDDVLQARLGESLARPRRLVKILRRVYSDIAGGVLSSPKLDMMEENNIVAFHEGVTEDDLRRIASFLLSGKGKNREKLSRIIPRLWKRHGWEDVVLCSLLLANLSEQDLREDRWIAFVHLLQQPTSLGFVLMVCEEITKAGHDIPDADWLLDMAKQNELWHTCAVVIAACGQTPASDERVRKLASTAPKGGEVFEMLRQRVIRTTH